MNEEEYNKRQLAALLNRLRSHRAMYSGSSFAVASFSQVPLTPAPEPEPEPKPESVAVIGRRRRLML